MPSTYPSTKLKSLIIPLFASKAYINFSTASAFSVLSISDTEPAVKTTVEKAPAKAIPAIHAHPFKINHFAYYKI